MDLNNILGMKVGKYEIEKKLGEGAYGVTFKARDSIRGSVAIKFIKKTDGSDWKDEAEKAAKLRDIPQIATVFDVGEDFVELNGTKENIRYIVWEFVEGVTLSSLFEKKKPIPSTMIIDLTEQLCLGIKGMQEAGLQHGDLNANNIILIPPKRWEPEQKHRIKIIDFGLARSVRGEKYIKDMEYLSMHLKSCWDCNQYYAGELLVSDKKFQNMLTDLIGRMTDQNLERRLYDPITAIERIYQIEEETDGDTTFKKVELRHPFEYLSVEEMPENSDLVQNLYADNVPWLQEIEGFGTTIISGPRGSGKSMILKNMRFLTKLRSTNFSEGNLNKIGYVGFYVHCQHSLYFPFAGIGIKFDSQTCDMFIHYLNLLFTAEILESLIVLEELNIFTLSPVSKNQVSDFLKENIFHEDTSAFFLSSKNHLSQCKSIIEKEILLTQKKIQRNQTLEKQTPVIYLQNLIGKLDQISDYFKDKPIYFLLDDYSHPKVDQALQKSINRMIGFRNSRFCFKITTEKFGFIQEDLDGKTLQQDREFSYIDLGARYIKAKKPEKKEFIKQILEKRLKRAKLNISVEKFFGPKTFKGKIADALIRDKPKEGVPYKPRFEYAGFDMIFRLCMGDVSTILQLCKEIYLEALNEPHDLTKGISPKIQDEIIRRFSHRRLEMIKEIPNLGMHLYQLVESFGNISKKYLYEYEKAEKDAKFLEVLRIELTENTSCLCSNADEMYKQLIANHIFLDGGGTYPWGKGIANLKLILRPIYTPALKISFSDRYTLRIDCPLFEKFLIEPEKFEQSGNRFLRKVFGKQETLDIEKFTVERSTDTSDDDTE